MNILTDFKQDVNTQKPIPGSYEWWYFDAQSIDGYSIVVIFYEGNPFSKRYIKAIAEGKHNLASHFPAVSISLYKDGRPLFYAFEEFTDDKCSFSAKNPQGNAGKNLFTGKKDGGNLVYRVDLNQAVANGDSVKGTLEFRSVDISFQLNGKDKGNADSAHRWNLIQPKATVTGELQLSGSLAENIPFKGTGYHDHNFGSEPMKDTFDEWYWGRYHLGNATLIYYLMRVNNNWEKKAWLLSEVGEVRYIPDDGITFDQNQLSLFALSSARVLKFENGDFNAHLQLDRLTDNGPFYQRFEGRIIATIGDKAVQSRGISEYIKPKRIYKKLFWPLVDMRIKYPGRAHWVQKSKTLYKWTW
ncbi:MAG: hypothetical protein EA391_08485 [Balneolaceae bacterium]|nr:MAG: hypothetical protein EA391_08485 [Balneolaceae bacterium]